MRRTARAKNLLYGVTSRVRQSTKNYTQGTLCRDKEEPSWSNDLRTAFHLLAGSVRTDWDSEYAGQRLASVRLFVAGHSFRRTLGYDSAASISTFGAEINNPIRLLDYVQVVLDDQHGVAERDQPLQHVQQFAHVVEMKSGGRLVQNVEGTASLPLGKFARQLNSLRFAA